MTVEPGKRESISMPGRKPKRPADVVGNAIRVAQIATGEAQEEHEPEPEKNAGRSRFR